MLLKRLDSLTHRRRRQLELAGSSIETAELDDSGQGRQLAAIQSRS